MLINVNQSQTTPQVQSLHLHGVGGKRGRRRGERHATPPPGHVALAGLLPRPLQQPRLLQQPRPRPGDRHLPAAPRHQPPYLPPHLRRGPHQLRGWV